MSAPLASCLCLLALFCFIAGCGDSQPRQEAKAADNSAAHQPAAAKGTTSAATDSSQTKSPEREFGFSRTWKPDAPGPSPTATKPPATTGVALPPDDDDNRYADAAAMPASSARGPALSGNPEDIAPRARPTLVAAGAVNPPSPAAGTDNPLRGGNPPLASRRPQDPPPAESPRGGDSFPAVPPPPPDIPQRPELKSELTIPTKPDEPRGVPATVPEVPAVPLHSAPAASPGAEPAPSERPSDAVRPGPRTNKNSGIPFDPVKENGPIFVGWPKPKLALVISGQQEGYLEPCGCAGLERMKGGMSRRATLFKMLREDPKYRWPVVGIDVGGTAKGYGKQAEIKFQIAINSMNAMRYSSAALGLSDLLLPTEEVLSQTMPANAQAKTMFVSGNVGLFAFDEKLLPRTQLINTGFKMIGVTAILGKTYRAQLAGNTNLKMVESEQLLDEAVPLLKKRADFLVLLAHATRDETLALAKKYPDFNLVVCSDGGAEPPAQAEEINKGGTKLIEVGEKGMCAIVIGLYDDPKQPMRYQRVTLDSRFKSSPDMIALMGAYQDQLKEMGLSGLGIRPLKHPLDATNGKYVGSAACQNCHEESYRVWKKTPHSNAFDVLRKANPPRTFDPECVSCHVVGWNPQKFFPYESGYLSEKETPKLINVGCEDCHGPGAKHCWAEKHGTAAEQNAARIAVRLTEQEAANPNCPKQNCYSCHDLDNSPEFKFNLYFPFIKHYERE
jgi:hypothetical protein